MSSPACIRFVFRGQAVTVPVTDPTRSVLQWLREDARACGSKEGCAEGDCGACTVLVAELTSDVPEPSQAIRSAGLALRPVNACIRFLPTLDGKALLTVDDLGGRHPAQQALVECHGSQCGFCTPGFVMSLAGTLQRHGEAGSTATRQQLADDLSGNLCRCTGYRPILDAGERMFSLAPQPLAAAGLPATLAALQAAPPLVYDGGGALFHAPRTLDTLAGLLAARPQARLLAGSTDIGLWVNKQFRALGEVVYLGEVAELKGVAVAGGELTIGAGASLVFSFRIGYRETVDLFLTYAHGFDPKIGADLLRLLVARSF